MLAKRRCGKLFGEIKNHMYSIGATCYGSALQTGRPETIVS